VCSVLTIVGPPVPARSKSAEHMSKAIAELARLNEILRMATECTAQLAKLNRWLSALENSLSSLEKIRMRGG
jgi:hypothetical protein